MKNQDNLTASALNKSNQPVFISSKNGYKLDIKRDDLIHANISGNKYRKLKYNILFAKANKIQTLLTFGGSFSNHIAAVAAAGKEYGLTTIGIIRGEELIDKVDTNPTLAFAKANAMQLHFITRDQYKQKHTDEFIGNLNTTFGSFYLLPEGGTNALAIQGCEEILEIEDLDYDYICVPVGTGGTLSGIINSSSPHQKIIGFSALKGNFLTKEVKKWTQKTNWSMIDDYCFDGYAKLNKSLIEFINTFKKDTGIPLDPIYTGKMMYGIYRMIDHNYFPKNSRILAIHTGGLQGILGMNEQLKSKKLPLILT